MNRNDYDRNQCLDFFQAYRDCKKDWVRACTIVVSSSLDKVCTSLTSVTLTGVLGESNHDVSTLMNP